MGWAQGSDGSKYPRCIMCDKRQRSPFSFVTGLETLVGGVLVSGSIVQLGHYVRVIIITPVEQRQSYQSHATVMYQVKQLYHGGVTVVNKTHRTTRFVASGLVMPFVHARRPIVMTCHSFLWLRRVLPCSPC